MNKILTVFSIIWKRSGIWIKVAVSALIIYYLFTKLEFHAIAVTLKSAEIWLLIVALIIYTLSQYVAADRLRRLFGKINLNLTVIENLKLYWLGLFYNLFLPGGVGGDGYKVYFLEKYLKPGVKKSLGTIITDRVSGLTVIGIFLVFFSYFINYKFPLQNLLWILIPLAILCFYFFMRIINVSLTSIFLPVIFRAFIVQLLQMIVALVILLSLDSNVLGYIENYIFLFFLSSVGASIPVTLGGIGAREVIFFWGAQYLGIDANTAVALSLLFYVISVISALPGVIYTIKPGKILRN